MFTGIIEAQGHIAAIERFDGDTVFAQQGVRESSNGAARRSRLASQVSGSRPCGDARMTIESASGYVTGANLGDSIAVNGVCLTAVAFTAQGFVADLSAETLQGTTASGWREGQPVNLEKALTPHKPLGGHMVSGHVDGIGHLVEKHEDARGWRLTFEVPKPLAKYIARKGSITIDGISLTVNEVDRTRFGVMIVPHTWQHTTLGTLQVGEAVNLEVDLIARYLERLLAAREE